MKVILQQDVKKLGKKGDIVEVSEGYGRNFLLPRKAAVPATAANLNVAEAQAGSKKRKEAMEADEAKLMAKQLEKVSVTIPVKIGANGKLFGSVTGKDVSEALKKQNTQNQPPGRSDRRGHLRGRHQGAPDHHEQDKG